MECKKCKVEKLEDSFYKGYRTCKSCVHARVKEWKKNNPQKVKDSTRRVREKNRESLLKKEAEYRELNREKLRITAKKYREANREKVRAATLKHYYENKWKYKKYREDNRDKCKEYYAKYRKNNLEKIRESKRICEAKSRKTRPLEHKARKAISQALKYKRIERPKVCKMCSLKGKIEAHHHDYTKPLDVIWVCKNCHGGIHLTLRT